jgi:hypothetical protein
MAGSLREWLGALNDHIAKIRISWGPQGQICLGSFVVGKYRASGWTWMQKNLVAALKGAKTLEDVRELMLMCGLDSE